MTNDGQRIRRLVQAQIEGELMCTIPEWMNTVRDTIELEARRVESVRALIRLLRQQAEWKCDTGRTLDPEIASKMIDEMLCDLLEALSTKLEGLRDEMHHALYRALNNVPKTGEGESADGTNDEQGE